jgi:hypothetical protein
MIIRKAASRPALKGKGYRLRERGLEVAPAAQPGRFATPPD